MRSTVDHPRAVPAGRAKRSAELHGPVPSGLNVRIVPKNAHRHTLEHLGLTGGARNQVVNPPALRSTRTPIPAEQCRVMDLTELLLRPEDKTLEF